jgi:FlaA1/EpsC-like NDP-sugar epimerase
MKKRRIQIAQYVIADLVSAAAAWSLLYFFRKAYLETQKFGIDIPFEIDTNFILGLVFVPLFWVIGYILTGSYTDVYRKHRLRELAQTLWQSVFGVTVIFFILLLDDEIASYKNYYDLYFFYFSVHFFITFLFRFILTTRTVKRIHSRKLWFNTLIIGGNERAYRIFKEIDELPQSPGNRFVGYIIIKWR